MGKDSAPPAPDYTASALATANSAKNNTSGPNGTTGWTFRPGADPANPQPGDYTYSTTLSPGQQQLYDQTTASKLQAGLAGQQQLSQLGNTQQAQDAYYDKATQYYDQNYGDQENALRTRLQNQGLTEGSEAWDHELRNFNQTKGQAYEAAGNDAILNSNQMQNSAVSRIAQLLAAGNYTTPTGDGTAGSGVDFTGAAQNGYNAQVGATNAANQASSNTFSGGMSLATLALLL